MDLKFSPITEQDLPLVHKWEADPAIYRFYNSGYPIDSTSSLKDYPDHFIISIDNNPVGVTIMRPWLESVMTMYYIGEEEYRGKGLALPITFARLEYIRNNFQINKVESFISINNVPAWKTLIKAGFCISGVKINGSKTKLHKDTIYSDELQMVYLLDNTRPKLLAEIDSTAKAYLDSNIKALTDEYNK